MKQAGRYFLFAIGWLSVVLGVIGIFLPLLPTTPFLLLAVGCFSRSSEHFHSWLLNHPKLGPTLRTWEEQKGIPRPARNRAIIITWCGMVISMLVIGKLWSVLLLSTIGLCVSVFLISRTLPDPS
jgi:hypothetical protein